MCHMLQNYLQLGASYHNLMQKVVLKGIKNEDTWFSMGRLTKTNTNYGKNKPKYNSKHKNHGNQYIYIYAK